MHSRESDYELHVGDAADDIAVLHAVCLALNATHSALLRFHHQASAEEVLIGMHLLGTC